MKTETTTYVVQQEYNSRRAGEADSWAWIDSHYPPRADRKEAEAQLWSARNLLVDAPSKFTRAYRLVKRVTITEDEVLAEAEA